MIHFLEKFCPLCYSVIVLWPLSHHIVTSAPKFFLTQFLTSFLGTFTIPLLSSSPHHINERSIKWLDPLILSLVCKYDMTDYYWSWVKTNLILTLHKIFSFDKVLQSYNLIQFIHPRLDLVNPNLVNYHDLVNKYQLQNYFTIANSI